jgi:Ca2+/Na+ antiporter
VQHSIGDEHGEVVLFDPGISVAALTLVAIGPSAPELCISFGAVFSGHPDV